MEEEKVKEKIAALEAAVAALVDTVDKLVKVDNPILASSINFDDVERGIETAKGLMRDCINIE
jgi:hypothetical protein